jgi:hypothetical protein
MKPRVISVAIVGLGLVLALVTCGSDSPRRESISRSRILYADSLLRIGATQAVVVTVQASATSSGGFWTYRYVVNNDASSTNNVETFAIAPIAKLTSVVPPAHWEHQFYKYQASDSGIVWAATDVGQLPPGYVDTGNVPPSEFGIHPADSLVFSIVTRAPPLPSAQEVQWFAQGFDTLPNVEQADDSYVQGTIFTEGVTGYAVGPDKNSLVGVEDGSKPRLEIGKPRPNPARGSVTVEFELPQAAEVELTVYDTGGRRIRMLASGRMTGGLHSVSWAGQTDAGGIARPGVYFYRLSVNGKVVGERRVTILK